MLKRLIRYSAAHRVKLVAVVIAMLATAGVELLYPWPLKFVVDNVVGRQPVFGHVIQGSERVMALVLAALAFVLFSGLGGILGVLYERWLAQISQNVSLAMSSDLYALVQRLSLRFHDRARVGDMVTRITGDVEELQEVFERGLSLVSIDFVMVFGMGAVMFLLDWQFALIALVVVPPLVLTYSSFRSRVKKASQEVRYSTGAMASLAQETLSSIRVVKAFGQEDREHQRFLDQMRSRLEASVRAITWEGLYALLVDFIAAIGIAIVLGYGGWRVIRGDLTLGQMLIFIQYLRSLYGPLRSVSRLTALLQRASASASRINELFDATPEVPESPHARSLTRARGDIGFENVWFSYETDRPVLKGIDLDLRAGQVVAVVGPTGAGKSTLASLIPRFYDPNSGRVFIDGIDARDLRVRSLREQVSLVLQDSILFSGTVRANIAYGRPGAGDREVVLAAKAANAHDFILALPGGYDEPVGERGVTLSGGQRQRIAIARALLKDAPILILDEPTSSVDTESEALIVEALARLIEGRTVLVITHRASLTALSSRVAVLSDGVITMTGKREDLAADGHLHQRLGAHRVLKNE